MVFNLNFMQANIINLLHISGPGYGLSFTANIEQYEYTKSTDKGIGIKAINNHYFTVYFVYFMQHNMRTRDTII